MHSLTLAGLILALIHFTVPLAYYWYLKKKYLHKPWNLKLDPSYRPKVTVIVPTYNEARLIEKKLDNIAEQEYPRDKLEVIIVDSASSDGTPEKVKEWAKRHPELELKLITEPIRRGMAYALQTGFSNSKGDVVVVTDADAIWRDRGMLSEAVKWLSSKNVGGVSCIKVPYTGEDSKSFRNFEEIYRQYYNVLRVIESKAWSTPIFHGEFSAFKRRLLELIGGFPQGVGSAESLAAMKIAALGYRVIVPETLVAYELVPRSAYIHWRVRRAQHLVLHFIKSLRYLRSYNSRFKKIVIAEAYIHLVNPWLFIVAIPILLYSILIIQNILTLTFLVLGLALLSIKSYRVWIKNQLILLIAQLRNLWHKELIWRKQEKRVE